MTGCTIEDMTGCTTEDMTGCTTEDMTGCTTVDMIVLLKTLHMQITSGGVWMRVKPKERTEIYNWTH